MSDERSCLQPAYHGCARTLGLPRENGDSPDSTRTPGTELAILHQGKCSSAVSACNVFRNAMLVSAHEPQAETPKRRLRLTLSGLTRPKQGTSTGRSACIQHPDVRAPSASVSRAQTLSRRQLRRRSALWLVKLSSNRAPTGLLETRCALKNPFGFDSWYMRRACSA